MFSLLVIVKSLKDMPPVNEETILFRKDNASVGKVFEVFGPVSQPFYVLRFNSTEDVTVKEIKLQEMLYFAPAVKDFTQYIFAEHLKQEKGSDASWRNDQEPPAEVSLFQLIVFFLVRRAMFSSISVCMLYDLQ
ncbi:hypothetical protein chiPu_0015110 [Chiloscyllium punctatum]|uniref:H/ACA ribonucleoprotein complex subunit n=1 Tax=Chiloscyllium punctatum TaxID=137246 RepID=A0A401T1U6_CHIPU|nr:hypothetical protein [Chiloscyllium punctatum]